MKHMMSIWISSFHENRTAEGKIGAFKNFAVFTEKHLSWYLLLIKLQNFIKQDSNTGVSCEYCKMFKDSFLFRTPPVAVSETYQKSGTETPRWDPGPTTLWWDPEFGPWGGTVRWDSVVGPQGGTLGWDPTVETWSETATSDFIIS